MLSVFRSVAIVVVAMLALAACTGSEAPEAGEASTDTPSQVSATPTPGTLVGLDPFALTLPEGWTQQETPGEMLLFAVSDDATEGIPTAVSVVEDLTLVQMAPEQLETERTDVLSADFGGDPRSTDITPVGEYEVDGEEGFRLTHVRNVGDVPLLSDEISVSHDESAYIVTFTFAPSVRKAERDAAIASLMDTWTWAQ